MATTTLGPGADRPAGRRLVDHLKRLRTRVLARVLGRGALASCAWLSLAAAAAILFQGIFGPALWLGLLLGALMLLFAAWVIGTRFIDPLRRYPVLRRFAWVVDRDVMGGGDEVIAAYDLVEQRERERDPMTRALIDHSVAKSLPAVEGIEPRVLDRGPKVMPLVAMLLLAAVILGVFHMVAPLRLKASWLALLHPTTFPYSPELAIEVMPGDLTVDTGADVRITAQITGKGEAARLLYRKEGGVWKGLGMSQIESGEISWMGQLDGSQVTVEQKVPRTTYRVSLPELRVDTAYRVRVGKDESDAYDIHVTTPPRIAEYSITTRHPDYAGIPDETLGAPVGSVAALLGSHVSVSPVVEGEAERLVVVMDDGAVIPLEPDASGRRTLDFDVAERFEYRVRITDESGRVRFESPSFAVDPLPDRDPVVRVIAPGDDTEIPEGMVLAMGVSAADDFGLTRLVLHVHKEPYDPFAQEIRVFEGRTREETVEFDWDLSSLEMLPGETATYWFELFDNDTVTGPKSSRSAIYEIRFPSMAELYSEAEEEYAEDVVDAVENIFEREKELKERLETLRQDVERSREGVTWERQKEVEGVMQSAQSLQQQLQDAMESMQRSMDRLGETDMSSFEILERMEMIQDLLEDVQDERLQAMMEEVRKALEEMDQRKLQEALEAFEFSQEDVLESLDRAVEHLKQVLAEQKLEAALDELQALVDEQAKINDELDGGDEAEETSSNDDDPNKGGDDPAGDPHDADTEETANDGQTPEGDTAEEQATEREGSESDSAENAGSETESAEKDGAESDAAQSDAFESDSQGQESEVSESGSEASTASESDSEESSAGEQMSAEEMEALAERQEQLREQLEKLAQSVEDLEKMARESHSQMQQQLDEAQPQRQLSGAEESMENASEQMQKPDQEEALRYGLSAQEQLQSLMNNMMSASQAMQAQRNAEAAREMMALGAELLHLSDKQERVVVSPEGAATRDMAAEQMRLFEATGRASETLHEIGKKTLYVSQSMLRDLGAVLDDMNLATSQLEAGNRSRGRREAHEAMSGLNSAVMDLLRAQQQMQQSGGACSNPQPNAMSRIPALSGMQEQLNQQTQSLQQQLSRGRLSSQTGKEALQQLAARQAAIRRGIQEIAEQLGQRRDVLGRLDEMGDELEGLVEDMRKGRLDTDVINRQQKILSRLLAAEKSIRQQDQDDKRLARSAEDQKRASPSALDEDALGAPERMEREILQGRTDPFPPRYRRMIEAYFKALGAGESR